jgi:hypothetical protein
MNQAISGLDKLIGPGMVLSVRTGFTLISIKALFVNEGFMKLQMVLSDGTLAFMMNTEEALAWILYRMGKKQ